MAQTLQERIELFRQMTVDDPDNDLAHFRLGQLLSENGQWAEAVASFRRTLMISPNFSKVYQLLAEVELKLGNKDAALQTLKDGYRVAEQRGDRIPRDEMVRMLSELGFELPKPDAKPGAGGGFPCKRPGCFAGAHAKPLAAPPMPDDLGRRIHAEICEECWNDWLRNYSIKVINELRLDLSDERGQAEYDKYMIGFFGFEDAKA